MESIGIASNNASAMAPFEEDAISDAMSEAAFDTIDQARKQARVVAVRGLLYARDAQLDRAEQFFTEAMNPDPALSPADIRILGSAIFSSVCSSAWTPQCGSNA